MHIEDIIFFTVIILVFASWIWYGVYAIVQDIRQASFDKFCLENSEKLLNGEECVFKGTTFTGSSVVASYQACISVFVLTMTRKTSLYRADNKIPLVCCTIITIFGGWWGIPWGPVRSIQTFAKNADASENYMSLASYIGYLQLRRANGKGMYYA